MGVADSIWRYSPQNGDGNLHDRQTLDTDAAFGDIVLGMGTEMEVILFLPLYKIIWKYSHRKEDKNLSWCV